MKIFKALSVVIMTMVLSCSVLILAGCGSSFWGGTGVGAGAGVLGTGAAYEINAKRQLDALEKEYASGAITQSEYEIRKKQIQKGSLVY